MLEAYTYTALVLFAVHITLRERYNNTVLRCAVWAALWPVDIAAVVYEWVRSNKAVGGDIDPAQLVRKLKDEARRG